MPFFDELTARGDEWFAVDGLREIKPDARVGEQPEHPARILRPSAAPTIVDRGTSGAHRHEVCSEVIITAEISAAGQTTC